jgi:hypothetical protein
MFIAIMLMIASTFVKGFASVLLFIVGVVFLIHSVVKPAEILKRFKESQNGPCPPHKWVYDAQGFLFCDICKKKPGDMPSSYDKPY